MRASEAILSIIATGGIRAAVNTVRANPNPSAKLAIAGSGFAGLGSAAAYASGYRGPDGLQDGPFDVGSPVKMIGWSAAGMLAGSCLLSRSGAASTSAAAGGLALLAGSAGVGAGTLLGMSIGEAH